MSAEALGIPAEIEYDKQIFRLGPANENARCYLEEILAGNAVKNVVALKPHLEPSEYQEMLAAVNRQVGTGQFKTGAADWGATLATPDGILLFYLSLFRVNHPNMTRDACKKLVEDCAEQCVAAMGRVAPSFFDVAVPKASPEQKKVFLELIQSAISKNTTPKSEPSMAL